MNLLPTNNALDSRQVRIFISSTFADFEDERRLLATHVFPELRRRARERLVEILEVDLRWGISAEQADRGEILPVCLAEIDRSRPFFIGLIGHRYGWTPGPEHFSPRLIESQPWLSDLKGGTSVTELEILHGVLNQPVAAERAIFFFRSLAYATERGFPFLSNSSGELQRVEQLKERIRRNNVRVVEDYPDPAFLALAITDILWDRIDRMFPPTEIHGPEGTEARRHEAQRRSRLVAYGGRSEIEAALDSRIGQGNVCVMGPSGIGKSAALAHWIETQRQVPASDLHYVFVGSGPESSLASGIVRRAWRWLADLMSVPSTEASLADGTMLFQGFALFVSEQRPGRKLVWVIDAVNQLSGESNEGLAWLPDPLPDWLHVVVSCLDSGHHAVILKGRGYNIISIPAMDETERRAMARRHLEAYGKSVDKVILDRIAEDSRLTTPFHAVTILRELRRAATHDSLGDTLNDLLETDGGMPSSILRSLLSRWDADVESWAGRSLCEEVLTLLEISETGLSEFEIRSITRATALEWSYVLGLLEDHLVLRGSELMIGHDLFRAAVREQWLKEPGMRKTRHQQLAHYFEQEAMSNRSLRMLLPQLEAIEQYDRVIDLLSDFRWTARAIDAVGLTKVSGFLNRCPPHTQPLLRIMQALDAALLDPSTDLDEVLSSVRILSEIHALDPAKSAYEALVQAARQISNPRLLAEALLGLGESEYRRAGPSGYAVAGPALEEAEQLFEQDISGNPLNLATARLSLGKLRVSRLRVIEAEELLRDAEASFIEHAGPTDFRVIETIKLRGITAFRRHLLGIGRWEGARPELLEGAGDLVAIAEDHWCRALAIVDRALGPNHEQARGLLHYLQEAPYALGKFALALPWLRRLDDQGVSADSIHRYACITALREVANLEWASGQKKNAWILLNEAEQRAINLAGPFGEPVARVRRHRDRLEKGNPKVDDYTAISILELPPQTAHRATVARWDRVLTPVPFGLSVITNPWLTDPDRGEVLLIDRANEALWRWHPVDGWRDPATLKGLSDGFVVVDSRANRLLRWGHARASVYAVDLSGGEWQLIAEGRHDVRGGGPPGWNAYTGRPFQVGGYGYFTHKNWWYEFDPTKGEWALVDENRPGTSPFPREAQIAPGPTPHSIHMFSGIGGETGIQWEHRARNGLAVASEIGWYTWLRDLWHLDLSTREWTCLLTPNHPSIRQEGHYTFSASGGWHLLRGGTIPAETWGEPSVHVHELKAWDGETSNGFQPLTEEGDVPPYSATGRWLPVPGSPTVLWIDGATLWTCNLERR